MDIKSLHERMMPHLPWLGNSNDESHHSHGSSDEEEVYVPESTNDCGVDESKSGILTDDEDDEDEVEKTQEERESEKASRFEKQALWTRHVTGVMPSRMDYHSSSDEDVGEANQSDREEAAATEHKPLDGALFLTDDFSDSLSPSELDVLCDIADQQRNKIAEVLSAVQRAVANQTELIDNVENSLLYQRKRIDRATLEVQKEVLDASRRSDSTSSGDGDNEGDHHDTGAPLETLKGEILATAAAVRRIAQQIVHQGALLHELHQPPELRRRGDFPALQASRTDPLSSSQSHSEIGRRHTAAVVTVTRNPASKQQEASTLLPRRPNDINTATAAAPGDLETQMPPAPVLSGDPSEGPPEENTKKASSLERVFGGTS